MTDSEFETQISCLRDRFHNPSVFAERFAWLCSRILEDGSVSPLYAQRREQLRGLMEDHNRFLEQEKRRKSRRGARDVQR
jgi:hypothetical protein